MMEQDILKVDFFARSKIEFLNFAQEKVPKSQQIHIICVNQEENTVKEVKIHDFFVCTFKSQDFAQIPENFARSRDRETVTFRNSGWNKEPFENAERCNL